MPKEYLSEYEAACATGMSPKLLRWLTKNAPKTGISRKLKIAKNDQGALFFEEEELLGFDNWLKRPWPTTETGQRPHVPKGIRVEVMEEAGGECAICNSHRDTCEAAHLDPVHKSKNNHPENLLWLCKNHHKAYDNGLYGPIDEDAAFVDGFKKSLHRYKLFLWRTQHQISNKLITVLEACKDLDAQLAAATTPQQVRAVETIAKSTLEILPKLAPVSKTDPNYEAVHTISVGVASLAKDKSAIGARLKKASAIREEYVAAFGFVVCPLCKGSGTHESTDCPVCGGGQEIEEQLAERVNLRAYEKVDCPVCEGDGVFRGDACPACGGEAEMDRRYAEAIDVDDYAKVDCPLCDGSGRYDGAPCTVCGGEGEIDRRHVDQIDLLDFQHVECPVCAGDGVDDGRPCCICGGTGTLQRRHVAEIDLRDHQAVDCPVCKGQGIRHDRQCDVCGGGGQVKQGDLANIDMRDFEVVRCPICKGRGYGRHDVECRACGGGGEVERRHLGSLDTDDYE